MLAHKVFFSKAVLIEITGNASIINILRACGESDPTSPVLQIYVKPLANALMALSFSNLESLEVNTPDTLASTTVEKVYKSPKICVATATWQPNQ
jgi:hypothetical protein